MSASRFVFPLPASSDPQPVLVAPAENRIFALPVQSRGFGSRVWFTAITDESVTAFVWAFDATTQQWIRFGDEMTLGGAGSYVAPAGGVPLGVPLFVQFTTTSTGKCAVGFTEV